MYRNVGNRGPRAIPFRASRGGWPRTKAPTALLGSWDATFITDGRRSPRVFEFRNGTEGLEAAYLANSGDYGLFWGGAAGDSFHVARFDGTFVFLLGSWDATFITHGRRSPRVFEFRNGTEGLEAAYLANSGDYGLFWGGAAGDSFHVARFDGTFVFLLEGRLDGDTLRGVFHAGLRTQTPYVAVRSTGAPHLVSPTALTAADTVQPFRFAFPDLSAQPVTPDDPRLKGKVLLVDIFGTWCSSCHEAMPDLLALYRTYHARGLEIVGLGYEVSGDSAEANRLIRRFRDKYRIPWPLLRAGINVVEETAATLPQLNGFTAYPTTLFVGRDGRIRQVYAGFRGPASGAQHTRQLEDYRRIIESLLAER